MAKRKGASIGDYTSRLRSAGRLMAAGSRPGLSVHEAIRTAKDAANSSMAIFQKKPGRDNFGAYYCMMTVRLVLQTAEKRLGEKTADLSSLGSGLSLLADDLDKMFTLAKGNNAQNFSVGYAITLAMNLRRHARMHGLLEEPGVPINMIGAGTMVKEVMRIGSSFVRTGGRKTK